MTAPSPGRSSPAGSSRVGGGGVAHVCRAVAAVLLAAVAGLVLTALAPRLEHRGARVQHRLDPDHLADVPVQHRGTEDPVQHHVPVEGARHVTAPPSGRSSPADTAPVGGGGAAHVCRAVAAVLLAAVAGLVLTALVPRLAGLQGHVVVSGSMEPQVSPGDVVLTRPVSPQDLQPGQVLLFPDPDGADRLLLHRLVSLDERGDLVTRGDANQSNDATRVPAASVSGQAQLLVPYVGLPAYWRGTGQWGHLVLLAVLLAAATVVAVGPAREPRRLSGADRPASPPPPGRAVRRPGRFRSTSAPPDR